MSVSAPLSNYKKTNYKIAIGVCLVFAIWFAYDGHFNETFIKKHSDDNGNPDSTLKFHYKAPPILVGAAVVIAGLFCLAKKRNISAGDDCLIINNKEKIPYDSIEKIDKTHFDKKGYFVITFNDPSGNPVDRKISDRNYDGLSAVLAHVVEKIT